MTLIPNTTYSCDVCGKTFTVVGTTTKCIYLSTHPTADQAAQAHQLSQPPVPAAILAQTPTAI